MSYSIILKNIEKSFIWNFFVKSFVKYYFENICRLLSNLSVFKKTFIKNKPIKSLWEVKQKFTYTF